MTEPPDLTRTRLHANAQSRIEPLVQDLALKLLGHKLDDPCAQSARIASFDSPTPLSQTERSKAAARVTCPGLSSGNAYLRQVGGQFIDDDAHRKRLLVRQIRILAIDLERDWPVGAKDWKTFSATSLRK